MSIVLFRVDERLIHGQVVVGWGTHLRPKRIVVVDDTLSASPWEQELYTLGLPPELEAVFATIEYARANLAAWRASDQRIIVLTRDLATMNKLARDGLLNGAEVNIGGIHYAAGRRPVLPYVYLSEQEAGELAALSAEGVTVSARDLPGSRRVDAAELLRNERKP
ncbi:MAG TPA: PTS sugar transporter subunit IIB [Longimicrobiales bacterium]|nr:PTS sugar transporter subunit IIB [Longimicrobiales bacterium]